MDKIFLGTYLVHNSITIYVTYLAHQSVDSSSYKNFYSLGQNHNLGYEQFYDLGHDL